MADDLKRELGQLAFKLRRKLVTVIKEQADKLATEIKTEVPVRTGKLRDSVEVRRGRHSLELFVTAGGEATTTDAARAVAYEREVKIGSGDTAGIARKTGGAGVTYDYALAVEFGTHKMPAQPFFYRVYRARREEIEAAISEAVEEVLSEG